MALRSASAELEAPRSRGDGVLDDVHVERDDPARPFGDVAEHQRQRHGQTVIDRHLVDQGEVEVVSDQRVSDVRREFGVALDTWDGTRPVPFVRRRVRRPGAEHEGRDERQVERCRMVVVDQEDDIGHVVPLILLGELVALEDRPPIGLLGLVVVHRRTDGRNVRGEHRARDHRVLRGRLRGGVRRLEHRVVDPVALDGTTAGDHHCRGTPARSSRSSIPPSAGTTAQGPRPTWPRSRCCRPHASRR